MPEIIDILNECFESISQEYEIERVDYLPFHDGEKHISVPVWRLTIQAELYGKISDVVVFIAFPKAFPFTMPWVVIPDERLKYLPHISFSDRKVCLYGDGVVYDTTNVYGLIKETISRTRRWIQQYSNQDNTQEYASEISSYWTETYDNENLLEPHWILLGTLPDQTCELTGVSYPVTYLGEPDKYFDQVIIYQKEEDTSLLRNINARLSYIKIPVLYLHSFTLPSAPPYSFTGIQFLGCIRDEDDRKICIRYINKHREGFILFPLGPKHLFGGVTIPKLNVYKKGFRKGSLSAIDILTKLDVRNRSLVRMKVSIYDSKRMAKRTAGYVMDSMNLAIAGLGSIGSNLCFFLNGYNNVQFALIDPDSLTIDNMGRHLLGFSHIDQRKVDAVSSFLTTYRPDRRVTAVNKRLEDVALSEINKANALFICTGDLMSERWLLTKMNDGAINIPTFILWLEPFGVSGVMVYVNPKDDDGVNRIRSNADKCFFDYCLIHKNEYLDGGKIIQKDAGCNGEYALYSANDVLLFLSSVFPLIDRHLSTYEDSHVYQWVGNIEIARQKGIALSENATGLSKNSVLRLE